MPTTADGIMEIAGLTTDRIKTSRYGFSSPHGWFFEQWTGKMGRVREQRQRSALCHPGHVRRERRCPGHLQQEEDLRCPHLLHRAGKTSAPAQPSCFDTAIFLASTANRRAQQRGDSFEVGTAYFPM